MTSLDVGVCSSMAIACTTLAHLLSVVLGILTDSAESYTFTGSQVHSYRYDQANQVNGSW